MRSKPNIDIFGFTMYILTYLYITMWAGTLSSWNNSLHVFPFILSDIYIIQSLSLTKFSVATKMWAMEEYNWRCLFHQRCLLHCRHNDVVNNLKFPINNNECPMPDAPSTATGDKVLIHMLSEKLRLPCIGQCVFSCVIVLSHQRMGNRC